MERTVFRSSGPKVKPFDMMDHKSSSLTIVLFGSTSAVYFGEDNILLRQAQPGVAGCDFPLVIPERDILGRNVSVINILSLQEAELYLDSVDHVTDQLVDNNDIHAFLFVLKSSHLTDTDKLGLEWLQSRFGESVLPYVMILFTYEREEDCNTIIDLKKNSVLEELLEKCGHRYHTCSKSMNNQSEMRTLLEKVDHLISENKPHCYTAEMYHAALKLRNNEERGPKMTRFPRTKPTDPEKNPNERRIVLLGKTGVGKSAAGNTILGENRFKCDQSFTSVTSESEMQQAVVSGRIVSVVDTPGLFDTNISPEELKVEIARSIYMSSPGPHAFLYVHPINGRFTEQEEQIIDILEMMFGEEMREYMIILFTHGDSLKQKNVDTMIKKNRALKSLNEKCRGYHIFNNEDLGNRKQVTELLDKIDKMMEQNGGSCYSNQMFEDAARFRQEDEESCKRQQKLTEIEPENRFRKRQMEQKHTEQESRQRENEQTEPTFITNQSSGGKIGRRWMEMCKQVEEIKRKLYKEKKKKDQEEIQAEIQKGRTDMLGKVNIWRKEKVKRLKKNAMFMAHKSQPSRTEDSAAEELGSGLGTFLRAHNDHLAAAGLAGAGYKVVVGTSAGLVIGAGIGAAIGLSTGPVGGAIGLAIGGPIGAACGGLTARKFKPKK